MKFKMESIILGFIIISTLYPLSAQEKMNPLRYEAWTVEYMPYKLLVEQAIVAYKNIAGPEGQRIPVLRPNDRIIIVRSLLTKSSIHQLWYGSNNNYTILDQEHVSWIFGETLRGEILNRNRYFNIDSKIVFDGENEATNYLASTHDWMNCDLQISLESLKYRFASSSTSDYAFVWRWGNPKIGLPFNTSGAMRWGIMNRFFEIGLRSPSMMNFVNGAATGEDKEIRILNGGFGAYGRGISKVFSTDLMFCSVEANTGMDPSRFVTDSLLNVLDLAAIGYTTLIIPDEFVPGKLGTFSLKFGASLLRVAHRTINSLGMSEETIKNRYAPRNGVKYSHGRPHSYLGGIYLRIEGISKITKLGFPRLETSLTLVQGVTVYLEGTLNLSEKYGIQLGYNRSLSDYDYLTESSIHGNIIMRYTR